MSDTTILNPEGLRIIPCNEIMGELEILNDRFTKCTVLSDVDMRKMTSLIYSIALCESNGSPITLNQNNIIRYINTPVLKAGLLTSISVEDNINSMPRFNVSETEIILFKTPVEKVIEGNKVKLSSLYHLMVGTGKGQYGSGGTALTSDNLFMVRDDSVGIIGAPSSSTQLYNISTSNIDDYNNNPHLVLNNAGGVFSILEGDNYYFKVSYEESLSSLGIPISYKVYRFIGPTGDYGAGGTNMASLNDFIFLEEDRMGFEPKKIKIREMVIPVVVEGEIDINHIINTGPWDTIDISENELVSFEVRKKIDLSDSMDVVLERYFWKNGKGVIRRDTISDDFLLYEKRTIINLDGTGGYRPPITGIEGIASDPFAAVNNNPGSIVQDSNEMSYIMIFDNTVDGGGSSVNIYEFTGAAGTYGDGKLQSTLSDFKLVADDKTKIEPLKGIEGGANVTIDSTDPTRPKISFTGGGGTVNSINGIFPDAQGEITLPLPEPTQDLNYKELLIGDWDIRATQNKSLPHGLPPNKWKSVIDVHVRIRNDADTVYNIISGEIEIYLDSNNLNLQAIKGDTLINANYSQLSYNRGWVTIVYK